MRPRKRVGRSAGASVTVRTPALVTTNVLVQASGANIRPSIPPSANTGRNETTMIRMAKKTGRPTSWQGAIRSAATLPVTGASPNRSRRRCIALSQSTMA